MNSRERYVNTLTFKNTDKVPLSPGSGRLSTLRRWRREGLPDDAGPIEFVFGELGIPLEESGGGFFFETKMNPTFEEKVLSHENGHYIVQDWMGAITEISDEFDYTYIRNAIDFVTRKWHKFPVETPEDWFEMKKRYDPADPSRLPEDIVSVGAKLRGRTHAVGIGVNGPFWQLREWMGMENLCMAFLEQPDFVGEMIDFWSDFILALFDRFLPHVDIDSVHISEDMAFKAHSMISPALTREFLMPVYKKWSKKLKQHGVPILDMDSDGYIEELVPIWIESGINVCDPIEVAAHNDIVKFRNIFGTDMAYQGGVDKREMAKGGQALVDEIKRVSAVLETGGYIPSCDHGIPHDVSFDNYRQYVKLLAQATGWL